MTLQEAIKILEAHNKWRRDNSLMPKPHTDPKNLGIAIDTVVRYFTHQTGRPKKRPETKYEFFATQEVGEGELYKHVLEDKTLYVKKDRELVAVLKDTQIMDMLHALGISYEFKKGFWK